MQLGIYEIFSRIVPGGLYIAAIAQFGSILGLVTFDLSIINNLSFGTSTALIIIAYILGGAFDIFSLAWFQLFRRPGFSRRLSANFKKKHEDRWKIDFKDGDWRSLLAYIRTRNLELAGEIDRQNAVAANLYFHHNSVVSHRSYGYTHYAGAIFYKSEDRIRTSRSVRENGNQLCETEDRL